MNCVSQNQSSKWGPDPSSKPSLGWCGEQSGQVPSVSKKEAVALYSHSHTSPAQYGRKHRGMTPSSRCQTDVTLSFCNMGVIVIRGTQLLPMTAQEGSTSSI